MPEIVVAAPEASALASTGADSTSQGESTSQESSQSTGAEVDAQGTESGAEKVEGAKTEQPAAKGDLRAVLKDPAKREALKALDPALPGILRDALHGREALLREFPGGLDEAVEVKKIVHEMGGREGLSEVKATVDDFNNLDKLYTEGNADFVKQIAEGDPDAFAKMVPQALSVFATSNPEQYQHIIARVLMSTFDGVGLSSALKGILQSVDAKAQPAVQEILDYVESFRPLASKIPEKKIDPERQKFEAERQEFQKKQFQALVKSVDSESIKHRDSLIEREIAPFGDWKTMDGDRRGAVANWISERVGRMLTADTGFMGRWNRLVQNGDREGLAKLERDKLSEVVPRLVPMAAKVFGVSKAAGKPQPKPAQAGQPAAKPAQGVLMVKGPPSIDKVDREATKRLGLAFNNQAKLKNGQIVQWA